MASESRHTPGPWHRNIMPARKYCVIFSGRNKHVAAIHHADGLSDEEVEANHDLFAAAPDMLAALKVIVDLARPGQTIDVSQATDIICDVWNVARAAIARAEARQS